MSLLLHLIAMNLTKQWGLEATVGSDDYKTRFQSSVISCEYSRGQSSGVQWSMKLLNRVWLHVRAS